jgi:hypothetical protein
MLAVQRNTVCAALQNIDTISLHTDDPGNIGDNESDITRESLTWSTPSGGAMKAMATFTAIEGNYTHIGLWEGDTFIHGMILGANLPSPQDLKVLVEFTVGVKS